MELVSRKDAGEIAFHSQRSRLGKYLILFLFLDISWILLFIGFLLIASGFPFVRPSPAPVVMVVTQIFMLILSIPALFLIIWISFFVFFTTRRLFSHKPVLLVTSQGLYMRDLPVTGNTLLSWRDIASLSTYGRSSNFYLCLNPREKTQFLLHFHWIQRLFIRFGTLNTGTLIKIPHWFLSESVGEILLQIQETFQDQIRVHEIHVLAHIQAKRGKG